jgi:hypothetical protein
LGARDGLDHSVTVSIRNTTNLVYIGTFVEKRECLFRLSIEHSARHRKLGRFEWQSINLWVDSVAASHRIIILAVESWVYRPRAVPVGMFDPGWKITRSNNQREMPPYTGDQPDTVPYPCEVSIGIFKEKEKIRV